MEMKVVQKFIAPAFEMRLIDLEVKNEPYEIETDHTYGYLIDMSIGPRLPNAQARYGKRGSSRFLGSISVLPPAEPIMFRCDPGTSSSVFLELQPDALDAWLGHEFKWNSERLEATQDVSTDRLRWFLGQLAQELEHPGFGHVASIELTTAQIVLELARLSADYEAATRSVGLAMWRQRLIDERLSEVAAAPTITELASLCHLSSRQLMRAFQATHGCSIGIYVARRRVELAKRLLAKGDSIKAIAHTLGFSSPSSFTYSFRRETGFTPHQFREHSHGRLLR